MILWMREIRKPMKTYFLDPRKIYKWAMVGVGIFFSAVGLIFHDWQFVIVAFMCVVMAYGISNHNKFRE